MERRYLINTVNSVEKPYTVAEVAGWILNELEHVGEHRHDGKL